MCSRCYCSWTAAVFLLTVSGSDRQSWYGWGRTQSIDVRLLVSRCMLQLSMRIFLIRKWRPIYFSQNVVTQGVSDIRCVFSPFYRMNGALFWHILLQWPRLLTINASKSAQVFSWKPTFRAPFFFFPLLGFMYHINSVTSDYQNSCLVKSGEFILSLCCIF